MSFTTILGFAGAFQGLVLAGVVASLGGEERAPNRALALILFVFSITVATVVAEHAGLFESSMGLVFVEYAFTFFFPPVLWYYAHIVLGERPRVPMMVHVIPAVLWVVYILVFVIFGTNAPSWRWLPPLFGLVIYMMAYTVAVAIKAWRSSARLKALVIHGIVLRTMVVLLFVIHIAQLVRYLFYDVPAMSEIVPLAGTVMIFTISVLALRQSRLFAGLEPNPLKKYDAYSLSSEDAGQIAAELRVLMDSYKPYLNENVNLAEIASRLSVPRAHLSQVINEKLESSFPQLLNEYRVLEASRLLTDPGYSHYTIEAVGYEVGFKSRSGFHSAYKRISGETPAQRRSLLS